MKTTIFSFACAIFLALPFFIWAGIRFLEKNNQTVYSWRRKAIGFSFLICFVIAIMFLCLAILLP